MRQRGVLLSPVRKLAVLEHVRGLLAISRNDVPQNRLNRSKRNDPFIAPDKPAYVIHFRRK